MNRKTTEETRLIVKFMGYELDEEYGYLIGNEYFQIHNMKFYKSFDWLMKVVKKIHEVSTVGIRITYDLNEQYTIVIAYLTYQFDHKLPEWKTNLLKKKKKH